MSLIRACRYPFVPPGRGDLSPTSGATPPDISAIPRTASNQNYNDSSTASLNKSAGAGALLDDASSDEGELGASQIDSFVTDHEAEIARLKTVLRCAHPAAPRAPA